MKATKSALLVGVGGQGPILTAKVLVNGLMKAGYDVKMSEVHGMSQRGGSVVTYVKYGDQVCSPTVEKGEADYILAFEQLEAARWLPYLKPDGKLIVNIQQIDPMPVVIGAAEYPQGVLDALKASGANITALDALSMAMDADSSKAVNVVLMGVLAQHMDLSRDVWDRALEETVPPKFLEMNKLAFSLGYDYCA